MVRILFPSAGNPLRTDFRGRIPSMTVGRSPPVGSRATKRPAASIETELNGDIDPTKLFGAGLVAQRDPNRWLNDRAYHGHHHTHGISALSLVAESLVADQPLDWLEFHRWLGDLRVAYGDRLLRVKGVLNLAGARRHPRGPAHLPSPDRFAPMAGGRARLAACRDRPRSRPANPRGRVARPHGSGLGAAIAPYGSLTLACRSQSARLPSPGCRSGIPRCETT
jgi:hypothetical protein